MVEDHLFLPCCSPPSSHSSLNSLAASSNCDTSWQNTSPHHCNCHTLHPLHQTLNITQPQASLPRGFFPQFQDEPHVRRPVLCGLASPLSRLTSSSLHVTAPQPKSQSQCESEQRHHKHTYEFLQWPHVGGHEYHPATVLLEKVRRGGRRWMRQDLSLDQLLAGLLPRGRLRSLLRFLKQNALTPV